MILVVRRSVRWTTGRPGGLAFSGGRPLSHRALCFDIGTEAATSRPHSDSARRVPAFGRIGRFAADRSCPRPCAFGDDGRADTGTGRKHIRSGEARRRGRSGGCSGDAIAGPRSPAARRLPMGRRCLPSTLPRAGRPSRVLCIFGKGRRRGDRRFRETRRRSTKIWGRRRRVGFGCVGWLRVVCYLPFFPFSIQPLRSGWDRSPGQIPVIDGTPFQLIGSSYGCPTILGHDIGHRGASSL